MPSPLRFKKGKSPKEILIRALIHLASAVKRLIEALVNCSIKYSSIASTRQDLHTRKNFPGKCPLQLGLVTCVELHLNGKTTLSQLHGRGLMTYKKHGWCFELDRQKKLSKPSHSFTFSLQCSVCDAAVPGKNNVRGVNTRQFLF